MASIPFVDPIDLALNEIQNATFQALATDPGSPVARQFWYNTTANEFRYYDGSVTHRISMSYLLARANHTGTQLANTISDFDTQVRTSRLDQMAAPTAAVAFNGQRITGVADPTGAQDAATKNYVDGVVTGLDWKSSARVATTANITLSGAQTIDGVSVVAGDRVLVKNQTTGANNGIYVAAAGAWARSSDADTSAEVTSGMMVPITEGTANGNTQWMLTTDDPITLGTTALTFTQFGSGTSYSAGTGIQITGNTIARDPTYIDTIAQGGTNASTAAGARANLGAVGKYSALIGNGSSTSFTINQSTHGLAADSTNMVDIKDASSGKVVYGDVVVAPGTGNVTISFSSAPAVNAYRVTIIG